MIRVASPLLFRDNSGMPYRLPRRCDFPIRMVTVLDALCSGPVVMQFEIPLTGEAVKKVSQPRINADNADQSKQISGSEQTD